MPNAYAQVALTYFQQPFSSVRKSFVTLSILVFLVVGSCVSGYGENHRKFLPIHFYAFTIVFGYGAIHLKEQFADSRASLVPGFRKVHGIVAAMVATAISVLLPGALAPMIGWQSLGLISVTTFLFGSILWLILYPRGILGYFIAAGYVSLLAESIRNSLEQIVLGRHPNQSLVLMGIGTTLSIAGILRLLLLNEEMPEYHLKMFIPREGRIRMSDREWQKIEKWYSPGWRLWLAERPLANLIYHAQHAPDSKWSRVRRWNVANLTVWSACFAAIGFFIGFLVMSWFSGGEIRITMLFGVGISSSVVTVFGPMWKNGSSFFHELMMPVRRDCYLKQRGMAVAFSQFIMWGASMISIILWIFISNKELHFELLAYLIAYSALIQPWMFGLAVWLTSFRSVALTIMIASIALSPTLAPIAALDAQLPVQWRPLILLIGSIFACLGLMLAWRAYRRWLVADFD